MRIPLLLLALGFTVLTGCSTPNGNTPAEERAYALQVRAEALAELAIRDPNAISRIEAAPGYIFVSGFAIHPMLLTFGNAYGIVQNNVTGEQVNIRLTRFAVGPGLALKGYYGVVLLDTTEQVQEYKDGAWYGLAFAESSFQFGDFGGSAAAGASGDSGDETWMWTHTGFSLELAAGLGKVYPEDELNQK